MKKIKLADSDKLGLWCNESTEKLCDILRRKIGNFESSHADLIMSIISELEYRGS